MSRTSQIVAGILLVPYVICGVAMCFLVQDRRHCQSSFYYPYTTQHYPESNIKPAPGTRLVDDNFDVLEPERSHWNRYCAGGYHGLLSVLGTLLLGFTIIIFRLLCGIRTRVVKYVHLILHVITLILFGYGLWCIYIHENSISYTRIHYHGITSWVVFGIFCVQVIHTNTHRPLNITIGYCYIEGTMWYAFNHHCSLVLLAQIVIGILVFAYLYPYAKLRFCAAPFHDLVGIWLFICCVACCMSGKRRARLDYPVYNSEWFYGMSYVCFTCILIVVLSPIYEWDLVGPL